MIFDILITSIPIGLFLLFWISIGILICYKEEFLFIRKKIFKFCSCTGICCVFYRRNSDEDVNNRNLERRLKNLKNSRNENLEVYSPETKNKTKFARPFAIAMLNDGSSAVVEYGGTKIPWCTIYI